MYTHLSEDGFGRGVHLEEGEELWRGASPQRRQIDVLLQTEYPLHGAPVLLPHGEPLCILLFPQPPETMTVTLRWIRQRLVWFRPLQGLKLSVVD